MSNLYRKLANQIDSILHMSVSMDAQNQMLEIVFKDSALGQPQDIPVDTVTTAYHDELMARWQKDTIELNKHHEELRIDWKRRLDIAEAEVRNLTKDLDECTKPKTVTPYVPDAPELEMLGDYISKVKSEILPIRQNAMVKGLVQTKKEAAEADAAFDKVRMTAFYTDKELKTIDKMPTFSGYSLIKNKWIYIKQSPLNQLALDESPFLNLRPKRPVKGGLNVNEVWQLRRYIKSGRRNCWIQKRMGLSSAAVSQMKNGRTYQKVPPELKLNKETTVHAGEGVISQK
ncbi:MAG: hypothetical protein DRH90_12480 [Deltaproteobacteria bacterium]|nr:MAG: hypothetical protein DRH90_12480 [Deltaproteobacteria bacterium]